MTPARNEQDTAGDPDGVATEAERTRVLIRPLNKALAVARTKAARDAIEAEIAALKAAWLAAVQPALNARHVEVQARHHAAATAARNENA